jgi:hypothetical protein
MLDHALTKMRCLLSRALAGLARDICEICRRVDERRRLSELSFSEWQDLGVHQVRKEATKWPWQG